MNSAEKARLQSQFQSAKQLKKKVPETWRSHARHLRKECRTHASVFKVGRAAQTPPIRFCVFAPGRTGSTLLFDLANAHPDVQCELDAKETELLHDRFLWPRAFVEARAKLCPVRAYGFKTKLGQMMRQHRLDPQSFLQSLNEDGWKMIYLTRRNVLRQTISLAIARQTAVWHRVRDENGVVKNLENGATKKSRTELDISLLLHLLEYEKRCSAYSDAVFQSIPHLKLEYENDLFTADQQAETMARVFEYLGLPLHAVSTRFERTGENDWRDALSNPRAVETALRGTPYEMFLDAP